MALSPSIWWPESMVNPLHIYYLHVCVRYILIHIFPNCISGGNPQNDVQPYKEL